MWLLMQVLEREETLLRDNLPIPEDEDIIMGIALGYESKEHINTY